MPGTVLGAWGPGVSKQADPLILGLCVVQGILGRRHRTWGLTGERNLIVTMSR